tara:strand:+ start:20506 stop:21942 length:1437 start_codon:yes stop_codon:yes gene_type:complete
MPLNPFFLQGSPNEQFLVQDLINEHIQMHGVEVFYLPRKIFKTDDIIREIQSSKFDDVFTIEAYINNFDGYAPDSDIMTKFGLRLKNEISLTISRERYEEFIAPFLEGISSGIREGRITEYDFADLITRPKEGDLIYFPLGERLFEIKRVEHEKPFYQLGSSYTYELSCELYEYENELIDTALEEVDNTVEDEGYITSLTLVGTARTAIVTAGISSGAVSEIFLNNDGSGYQTAPTITFSAPPVGGTTATAVGITTRVANVQSLLRIELTNAGSGYVTPPTITISGGSGTGAAATCSIGGTLFSVSSLSITDPGNGYASAPVVTIGSPGTGTTATALVTINAQTKINSARILNPGVGYTEGVAPTVSLAGFSTIGVGTFVYNEIVTGETSGTTARVRDFRTTTSPLPGVLPVTNLRVSLNTGKFSAGEIVVGSISSARYVVSDYDTESYDNPYDVNEEIETEADDILDFTESNPFGTY